MNNRVVGRTKVVRLIKWVQLSSGRMKPNVDGACIKGVNASYEGLVKDEEGC